MADTKKHIALVCPGAPLDREVAKNLGEFAAAQFGDKATLYFHEQCFTSEGHFAGDDATRGAAFLEVANDPAFDAVWFGRGGYGAGRLDPGLYAKLNEAAQNKIYFGHSDCGIVQARLDALGVGRPVFGPVAAEFARPGGDANIERALRYLISGDRNGLEATARDDAPIVAFNITVLASFIGADWAPNLSGRIVLLEDVGEYLYRIDRAMGVILDSAKMRGAAGVKIGRISNIIENDRPFGADEVEICQYWCARAGVPYLGRADIGHDAENKIVPFRAPEADRRKHPEGA